MSPVIRKEMGVISNPGNKFQSECICQPDDDRENGTKENNGDLPAIWLFGLEPGVYHHRHAQQDDRIIICDQHIETGDHARR